MESSWRRSCSGFPSFPAGTTVGLNHNRFSVGRLIIPPPEETREKGFSGSINCILQLELGSQACVIIECRYKTLIAEIGAKALAFPADTNFRGIQDQIHSPSPEWDEKAGGHRLALVLVGAVCRVPWCVLGARSL